MTHRKLHRDRAAQPRLILQYVMLYRCGLAHLLAQHDGQLRDSRSRLGQSPGTALSITALLALSVVAIWVTVQPLRSSGQYAAAVGAISRGQTAVALTDARAAAASNPVSVDPRFLLSVIYTGLGNRAEARAQLLKAVSTQPSNPATWAHLGCYDVHVIVPDGAGRYDFQLGKALQLAAAHPARQQRHERDVVTRRSRLIRREPGDVQADELLGLEQPLQLGGDEDGVTHYLLICARRIESSTASARAGLHL